MKALLNMTGCRNKGKLSVAVPIYLKMAKADKLFCLSLFQAATISLLDNHDIKGIPCMITLIMFNNLLLMKRDTITVDSVNTGWL